MSSGLNSGPRGNRTDEIYFGGGRVRDHAGRAELEAVPGSRWRYANNDTLLVMRHHKNVTKYQKHGSQTRN